MTVFFSSPVATLPSSLAPSSRFATPDPSFFPRCRSESGKAERQKEGTTGSNPTKRRRGQQAVFFVLRQSWGEALFFVFSAVAAEFWLKAVMSLRTVQKLAFKHKGVRTSRQVVRPQPPQAVFFMFFSRIREIRGDKNSFRFFRFFPSFSVMNKMRWFYVFSFQQQ